MQIIVSIVYFASDVDNIEKWAYHLFDWRDGKFHCDSINFVFVYVKPCDSETMHFSEAKQFLCCLNLKTIAHILLLGANG